MIEPINFGGALRRSWRLLAVLAVVFALVAVLIPVGGATPKKHNKLKWQASAVVGSVSSTGLGQPPVGAVAILYAANSTYIQGQAVKAADPHKSLNELIPTMTAKATSLAPTQTSKKKSGKAAKVNQFSVINLTTHESSRQLAAALTNAYAVAVGNYINKEFEEQQRINDAAGAASGKKLPASPNGSGYEILISATTANASKVKKKSTSSKLGSSHKVRLLVGILLGLVVGAGVVLLRELLDKKLRTRSRAEGKFRLPVVVEIPERSPATVGATMSPVEVVGAPTSPIAEAYRMLRMSVMFEGLAADQQVADPYADDAPWAVAPPEAYEAPEPGSRQVVLVVSPGDEDARSSVAVNLAATYGEAGQRVIVISTADIGSGYADRVLANGSGAFGPDDLAAKLEPSSLQNVWRLSLRQFVGNSGQLVNRGRDVLDTARQLADVIIVEAPPLLAVHHGEALVHAVDVVLVVAECGVTTMDQAHRAGELLRRLGAPVLGVVLAGLRLTPRELRAAARQQGAPPAGAAAEPKASAQPVPEATQA